MPAGLDSVLAVELDRAEVAAEHRLEVVARELQRVERVLRRGRGHVDPRGRDDEDAVGAKHARRARQERFGLRQVLDRLERADDVEGIVRQVELREVLLHELDVAPRGRPQRPGVVVTVAGHGKPIGGQLVPLLAGHLARLAADAQAGIREEAPGLFRWRRRLDVHQPLVGVDHRSRPLRRLQVKALSSWM